MMAYLTKWGLFGLLVFSCTSVQAEVISKFVADYTIDEGGEVTVVETITYDFEGVDRHGLYRTIENKHPQPASAWYKRRTIDLSVMSVTREGVAEPYDLTRTGRQVELKIGNPDTFVSGVQTYVITYTLAGALSKGDAGAEFYYNVTGSNWEVPIELALATVHSNALATQFACYQGESGAQTSCTNSMKTDDGSVVFTANNLPPGTGLTIATELDPTKVTIDHNEYTTWLLFGYVLGTLWAMSLFVYAYRFRYAHYRPNAVVAQYEPYQNFLPMYTGYLFDNILDPKDISAGIVYLAEQGFIKITRTTNKVLLIITTHDYTITLRRPLSELSSQFLSKVAWLLFVPDAPVGTEVSLSTLAKNHTKNAEVILNLKRDLEADLKAHGFLESTFAYVMTLVPRTLVVFVVLFGGFVLVPNGILLVGLVFGCTLVIGLILLIPRKTASWFEARNHLEGFKLFLSVTDKERFDFHNAPEKSPELFMQYLPYAIALGVEEKWAQVFADITIPQPDWLEGGTLGAFSANALTTDLGAFATAFSASSGVSGSSGGGSSGGGGGGGGGGSW